MGALGGVLAQPPICLVTQPQCNPATGPAPSPGWRKMGSGSLEVGVCELPEQLLRACGSCPQHHFFIGCGGSSLCEGFL